MRTIVTGLGLATIAAGLPLEAQVTFDRIFSAEREPQNWLSYSGTVDNQRYSLLDEIDTQTVGELELQWVWQARSLEKFEATALVVDGILYTVQAPNDVAHSTPRRAACSGATTRAPPEARACCGRVNRGLAISATPLPRYDRRAPPRDRSRAVTLALGREVADTKLTTHHRSRRTSSRTQSYGGTAGGE